MCAYHAGYRNVPMVVISQDEQSHKSAVVSCSPKARELGMDRSMPLHTIKRRWPGVVIVKRDNALEKAACEEIGGVLYRYSPDYDVRVSGASIVNLSRTPSRRGMPARAIGGRIRDDIVAAVPLSDLALGLAANAPTARIMARAARPAGVRMCEHGLEQQTLRGLGVSMLPGLSPRCRARLAAYGINTIGQVQALAKAALLSRFGAEGEKLYSLAGGGTAECRVTADRPLIAETVLDRDIVDMSIVIQRVNYTVDKFCFLLKSNEVLVPKFTLSIRYSDGKKAQKTVMPPQSTNDFLTLAQCAQRAFLALYRRRVALRAIALDAKNPRQDSYQTNLLETAWEHKQAALARQIVKVRNKNHFESVVSGATLL